MHTSIHGITSDTRTTIVSDPTTRAVTRATAGVRRRAARTALTLCTVLVAALALVPAAHAAKLGSFAPHLNRTIVATRASLLGSQVATWYGPGFYGHSTACGGRLQPTTWGIAHRTLPCGTLVTISTGTRKVTVPVIDRGPYSGATVDLTSRTKSYLGFVSGSVRMAQVRSYRVLPLH